LFLSIGSTLAEYKKPYFFQLFRTFFNAKFDSPLFRSFKLVSWIMYRLIFVFTALHKRPNSNSLCIEIGVKIELVVKVHGVFTTAVWHSFLAEQPPKGIEPSIIHLSGTLFTGVKHVNLSLPLLNKFVCGKRTLSKNRRNATNFKTCFIIIQTNFGDNFCRTQLFRSCWVSLSLVCKSV